MGLRDMMNNRIARNENEGTYRGFQKTHEKKGMHSKMEIEPAYNNDRNQALSGSTSVRNYACFIGGIEFENFEN
jgi:hypothetical protein